MTGGKKKRRDIQRGVDESEQFTNRAIERTDPFREAGLAATNQLRDAAGIGTGSGASVLEAFEASPFAEAFRQDLDVEKSAVDEALAAQGGLFSGARQDVQDRVRGELFSSSLRDFLGLTQGLANQGFAAATNQSGTLANQGRTAANLRLGQADTRQGVLGGLTSFGRSLNTVFPQRLN